MKALLWLKCYSSVPKGILATEYHKVTPHNKPHTRGWLPLLLGEATENWAGGRFVWGFLRVEISRLGIGGMSSSELGESLGVGGISSSGIDVFSS